MTKREIDQQRALLLEAAARVAEMCAERPGFNNDRRYKVANEIAKKIRSLKDLNSENV